MANFSAEEVGMCCVYDLSYAHVHILCSYLVLISYMLMSHVGMWMAHQGLDPSVIVAESVDGKLLLDLSAEDMKSDLGLSGLQAKKVLKNIEYSQSLNSAEPAAEPAAKPAAGPAAEPAAEPPALDAATAAILINPKSHGRIMGC